jgi:site-specific DNA recombinase
VRKAVGIVRVSSVGGREGESFISPTEQRERIEAACEREGFELTAVHQELDVSGGTPLERRRGLREAVEAVESGAAAVVVAAYFDRLVRSLRVQEELVSRVERAGGSILAVDVGAVSHDTATRWVQSTMLGMVAEYQRRVAKERSGEAQARAVARGVCPFPRTPPGYRRGEDGVLVVSEEAPVVAEAFARRAEGATIRQVRAFLAGHGIERSYRGTQSLLTSRLVLGEIHFGRLVNLTAHPPIVDRGVWQAAQRVRVSRGRRAKSERLLARLGVLRCGTCGARMVVGSGTKKGVRSSHYRCPPTGDCPQRMAISAQIAERVVSDAVREFLADAEGRASAEDDAREAEETAERAQQALDAAIRTFAGLEDEQSAVDRLTELRRERDIAREEAHRLGSLRSVHVIRVRDDWGRLTMEEQRSLIAAAIECAVVGPGRGPERIAVHFFSK